VTKEDEQMEQELPKTVQTGKNTLWLVATGFFYFFLIIGSYYFMRPLRSTYFLCVSESKNLSLFNIATMLSLIPLNAIYSFIAKRFKREYFVPLITLAISLCIPAFKFSLGSLNIESCTPASATSLQFFLSLLFYIYVSIFSVLNISIFWSLLHDIFTLEMSKKYYALIGYGGLLGGIAGSYAMKNLSGIITDSSNLLYIAFLCHLPTVFLAILLNKMDPGLREQEVARIEKKSEFDKADKEKPENETDSSKTKDFMSGLITVISTPLLILMALEMFTYTASSSLYGQQFNSLVEKLVERGPKRTEFFATIEFWTNLLSLVSQGLLTWLCMRFLSAPVTGLMVMSIIQLVPSVFILLTSMTPGSVLTTVSYTMIAVRAIEFSTGRILRESIYVPLPYDARYQGKNFIDTVMFRVGSGVSALLLFAAMRYFGYGKWINICIILIMLAQLYILFAAGREYLKHLKNSRQTHKGEIIDDIG